MTSPRRSWSGYSNLERRLKKSAVPPASSRQEHAPEAGATCFPTAAKRKHRSCGIPISHELPPGFLSRSIAGEDFRRSGKTLSNGDGGWERGLPARSGDRSFSSPVALVCRGPPFFRRASAMQKAEVVDMPGMGGRDARAPLTPALLGRSRFLDDRASWTIALLGCPRSSDDGAPWRPVLLGRPCSSEARVFCFDCGARCNRLPPFSEGKHVAVGKPIPTRSWPGAWWKCRTPRG
jgi:hypothetical protein